LAKIFLAAIRVLRANLALYPSKRVQLRCAATGSKIGRRCHILFLLLAPSSFVLTSTAWATYAPQFEAPLPNHPPQNLTVATTGASGAIFLRHFLLAVDGDSRVQTVNFIASDSALRVLAEELDLKGR